jgi:hypothetical protein
LVQKVLVQGSDVWKVLVMLPTQDLVCIDFQDRGFVKQADFPKAGSMVFVQDVLFAQSTMIDSRDLSFTVSEVPL